MSGHIRGLEALNLRSIDPNYKIPTIAFLSANPQLKSLLMSSPRPKFLRSSIYDPPISRLEPQVPHLPCRDTLGVQDSFTNPCCNQADIVPRLTLDRLRGAQSEAQKMDY